MGARRGRGLRRRRRPDPVLRLPARLRRDGHRRSKFLEPSFSHSSVPLSRVSHYCYKLFLAMVADWLDIRVHEWAGDLRRRRHRQPALRADPGLLRRHRHPDLRTLHHLLDLPTLYARLQFSLIRVAIWFFVWISGVSVVHVRADGEQGRRGARPQRRLPVTPFRGGARIMLINY